MIYNPEYTTDLGHYHIQEFRGGVESAHLDIVELAKELGCLNPGEVLEGEPAA